MDSAGSAFGNELRREKQARGPWVTEAEGGKPVQVTQISPEIVTAFRWMADSRRLVVEAGTRTSDMVLIRDFR